MTQYYPNPNLNQKNNPKFCRRIPNPITNNEYSRKGRIFAALVLGRGIHDTSLYLNQLIREPGRGAARSTSQIIFYERETNGLF